MIDNRDALLLNCRYVPFPATVQNAGQACVVYDPLAVLWRMFYTRPMQSNAQKIYQRTAPNWFGPWGAETLALDVGAGGTWDAYGVGWSFAWYQAGLTYPWQMIYRGISAAPVTYQIGGASSLDGVTWERKDCNGDARTNPIVLNAFGECAIAPNCVIRGHDGVYYLHLEETDSILNYPRLATSTDLITWTPYLIQPTHHLWTGVVNADDPTQGPDKNYDGVPDLDQGFGQCDVVRDDELDGTIRYVMRLRHFNNGATLPTIDVFKCPNPMFLKADREYIGKAFKTDTAPKSQIEGCDVTTLLSIRTITDTIERNVKTSVQAGDWEPQIITVSSAQWGQYAAWLLRHKTLHGAVLSNVCADLPISAPVHALAPTVDANTVALYIPSVAGGYDLTGNGRHLNVHSAAVGSKGWQFTGLTTECARWDQSTTTPAAWNALGQAGALAFTIEMLIQVDTAFPGAYGRLLHYAQTAAPTIHFAWYLYGAGGDVYTMSLQVVSGGLTKTLDTWSLTLPPGEQHWVAISRSDAGHCHRYLDGVLVGDGDFAWAIDSTAAARLVIGATNINSASFKGRIDYVRLSNNCRYPAAYTPATFGHVYQSSGSIFGRVHDFGKAGYLGRCELTQTAPTNTTITKKSRKATSLTNQSETDGDFTAYVDARPLSRYQQHEIVLATTDTAVTPTVSEARISGRAIGSRRWRGRMGG